MKRYFYARYGKRVLDALLSFLGLVALSPLFLICVLLIRISSPGSAFFRQVRIGLNGTPFRMYKFRSMFSTPRPQGSLLTSSNDPRITPVGKWIRRTKIDELPQLINVLLGHMSLVGPRPEVLRYTNQYTADQCGVLSVRPGITGLASLAFPSEEQLLADQTDKEHFYVTKLMPLKIAIDLQYCRNITFLEDVRILLKTLFAISESSKPQLALAVNASDRPDPSQ